jgi:monofunctional biosynthetic peptidoglycan transglycosylase
VARKRFRGLVLAWKAFCYTLGIVVLAVVAIQVWFFAHILYWSEADPKSSAFMERYLETPGARLRHAWVPYERISTHLKRAAIQTAMQKNEQHGKVVAGASTISQQLAKNMFLSGSRSYLRKGEEAIITWMMERTLSKRRILELYLNLAEWGDGVFGAEAAARHHFGVPASALTAEQAAWLAAILPSPKRYDRGRETPYISGRMLTIAARMDAAQVP